MDLSAAAAVFVYIPPAGLTYLLARVLPRTGIPVGTPFFSADGPLRSQAVLPLQVHDRRPGLHCYTWLGQRQDLPTTRLPVLGELAGAEEALPGAAAPAGSGEPEGRAGVSPRE